MTTFMKKLRRFCIRISEDYKILISDLSAKTDYKIPEIKYSMSSRRRRSSVIKLSFLTMTLVR